MNFYEFESNRTHLEVKISVDGEKCFQEWQFAASVMHLELRRELRKRTGEKARRGSTYRRVKEILCFLEGGHPLEGRV